MEDNISLNERLREWFATTKPGTEFTSQSLAKSFDVGASHMQKTLSIWHCHRYDLDQNGGSMVVLTHDGLPDPLSADDVSMWEGVPDPNSWRPQCILNCS